jgi:hypothetical protein
VQVGIAITIDQTFFTPRGDFVARIGQPLERHSFGTGHTFVYVHSSRQPGHLADHCVLLPQHYIKAALCQYR